MLNIFRLRELYSNDENSIFETINNIYDQIEKEDLNPIWISIVSRENSIKRIKELLLIEIEDRFNYPLFCIPFAVKDNFDVIGFPTTCGCKTFSFELAKENAFVVQKLFEAGGILIGKTNLDQFATGLVGTRSPYGSCSSVFNSNYISGGSSSGSAVAVAKQLVTFSLGSDTAGSGRVPAMFNNIIGLKPSRGLISTRGLIPACRSLDCVSIFSETINDASIVLSILEGYDQIDPYSREKSSSNISTPWLDSQTIRFGIPTNESRQFFGDFINPILFEQSIQRIQKEFNGELIQFDLKPFIEVANLLYKGPWVSERYAAVGEFIEKHPNDIDPIVYSIIQKSKQYSGFDVFNGIYQLEKLKKQIKILWDKFDVMIVPTAPRMYRLDEISSSPIEYNSNLGYYTNFVNLLDYCGISIPSQIREDDLPFSITILSESFTDNSLLIIGDRIHRLLSTYIDSSKYLLTNTQKLLFNQNCSNCFLIGVVGAHLSDQPLNYQLIERKSRFVRTCLTTKEYRLYLLKDSKSIKPGLLHINDGNGKQIQIEIWSIPNSNLSSFIQMISSPLSIGNISLEDGKTVQGFLVQSSAIQNAEDITHFGGWKAFISQNKN